MDAQIITIGTELLLGQIVDTNSAFIAEKLARAGINVYHKRSVGDNKKRLKEVLHRAKKEADVILTTGGMGPTSDDITIESAGEVWQRKIRVNDRAMSHLKKYLSEIGAEMSPSNKKQTYFPEGSRTIPNPNGTALGMILEGEEATIISMPGVSEEMELMMTDHVIPYLKSKLPENERKEVIKSRKLRICGMGESTLQEKVADFLSRKRPTVAPLAKLGEVHLRITAKGTPREAEELISSTESELRDRLGDLIYGTGEDTLQKAIIDMLAEKGHKLSVLESSSGGTITQKICRAEGGSQILERGLTLTSRKSIGELLELPPETFEGKEDERRNLVERTAIALNKKAGTEVSLVTSDFFSPQSPQKEETDGPEGKITFFSLARKGEAMSEKFRSTDRRGKATERIAKGALTMLYKNLTGFTQNKNDQL